MEMKFGKKTMTKEAYNQAKDILGAPPKKVLVFGGGKAAKYLKSEGYEPIVIDTKEKTHVGQDYKTLITPVNENGWYDADLVKGFLKGKSYDMIICDGPSNRMGLFTNLSLFKDVPIILEDTWRKKIFQTASKIAEQSGKTVKLNVGNGRIDSWALIQ